ncbi:MAG: formate/nitrite transporter family protein [Candidatus Aenigmarchaeota archaeon]|nr:formate/nitrite transporter family protein [Candidatus Aenigmarchaeota archaeon]
MKSPKEIAEEALDTFILKGGQSATKIFVLAFLAGVFISFGSNLAILISLGLEKFSFGFSRFLAGSAFSFGLILIFLTGAEFFSANTLMIIPLAKKEITKRQFLKSLAVSWVGNFIGCLTFSFLIFYSGIYNNIASYGFEIASNKVSLSFLEAFLRGLAGNCLICLAVWLSLAGTNMLEKIVGIYIPSMLFFASGFEDSIANMFFIPLGILLKDFVVQQSNLSILTFFLNNLLPVTIGNIIGGIFLGLIYYYLYLKEEVIL